MVMGHVIGRRDMYRGDICQLICSDLPFILTRHPFSTYWIPVSLQESSHEWSASINTPIPAKSFQRALIIPVFKHIVKGRRQWAGGDFRHVCPW